MLSGESAKGRYPVQSVAMMQRIVEQSEQWAASSEDRLTCKSGCDTLREGVAHAVVEASRSLQARCIIVHSHSGDTARDIAKYRPHVPILAFAHTQKVGRMLQLYRGVHPLVLPPAEEAAVDLDPGSFGSSVLELERAVALGFCKAGDTVILVSGERGREGSVLGSTVSMRVAHVQRKI
jgi:pyruvate kinase